MVRTPSIGMVCNGLVGMVWIVMRIVTTECSECENSDDTDFCGQYLEFWSSENLKYGQKASVPHEVRE